ncbi:hypothetical protein JZ751_014706 [Albula glossodonta]|uniref:Uncharacterized protein n=1 Tax=Albula glossodonta TaxID=121402 RepID=A0A8T2N449_9TELE|nr:hypothetical protein JZ751_014706 [Albula glossodonta]
MPSMGNGCLEREAAGLARSYPVRVEAETTVRVLMDDRGEGRVKRDGGRGAVDPHHGAAERKEEVLRNMVAVSLCLVMAVQGRGSNYHYTSLRADTEQERGVKVAVGVGVVDRNLLGLDWKAVGVVVSADPHVDVVTLVPTDKRQVNPPHNTKAAGDMSVYVAGNSNTRKQFTKKERDGGG